MDVLREGFTLIKQSFPRQFSNLADIEIFIWWLNIMHFRNTEQRKQQEG